MAKSTDGGIDLNQNNEQLFSVWLKALNISKPPEELPHKIRLKYPNLYPIPHDAYSVAMNGPYGSVIRQIFESDIFLFILQEICQALSQKLYQEALLIQILNEKYLDENRSSGGAPKSSNIEERINKEEEYHKYLELQLKAFKAILSSLHTELLNHHTYYITQTDNFIRESNIVVINHAITLGYDLNEEEQAIISSPMPRAEVEKRLQESLAKGGLGSQMPQKEDFSTQHLADLELRTLLALSDFANRKAVDPGNFPLNPNVMLKDFSDLFKTLDGKIDDLHKNHQIKTEEISNKIRTHIENANNLHSRSTIAEISKPVRRTMSK
jgi:hypothetical protein